MFQPRRTKHKKQQTGSNRGTKQSKVEFGEYGLKATTRGRITSRQLEAARRQITRETKRQAKLWIRIFPDVPVTKKPLEVRMGKGKGNVDRWEAKIQPGRMLFEIGGIEDEKLVEAAFKKASAKWSIKTTIVKRTVM